MKNETNYVGFLIIKIWQILKCFYRAFKLSTNLLFLKSAHLPVTPKNDRTYCNLISAENLYVLYNVIVYTKNYIKNKNML